MSESELSRRGVLKLGTAASVAALAGCGESSPDGTDDIQGISDIVPAGPNLLMRVDMETILGEGVTRDQFDAALSDLDSGFGRQPTVSTLLTSFEEAFELDPREVTELTSYVDLDAEESAAILATEWSEDQIQTAIEADKQTYNGRSIYQADEATVGLLPDGRYIASTPPVTRKVIDVATGNRDSVTGDIVSGFNSTSDGYVRFAFTTPAYFNPGTQSPFDFSPYGEVSYGYGSLFRDGETLNSEVALEATSADAATDIEDLTNQILEVGETEVSNDAESFPEDFGTVLDSTETSQSGTTVRVEIDDDRGYALMTPLAVISSFVLGFGEESSDRAPTSSFSVEYRPTELSVIKASGDDFRASSARIQGTVTVGNASDSTQTETFEFDTSIDVSEMSDQFSAALGPDLRGSGHVRFEGVDSPEVTAGDEFSFVVDDSTGNAEIAEWNVDLVWDPTGSDSRIIYTSTS